MRVCSYGSEVEHFLGKEEVEGSSPSMSSISLKIKVSAEAFENLHEKPNDCK